MRAPLLIPIVAIFILAVLLGFSIRYALFKSTCGAMPVATGALVFLVCVVLLERAFHLCLLFFFPKLSAIVPANPLYYALYGSCIAAGFEEVGRYIAFTQIIPGCRKTDDAIGYGIGHGGMELFLLGIIGMFPVSAHFTTSQAGMFWVFERGAAFAGQVALSVVVFCSVVMQMKYVLLLSIILHFIADVPVRLYRFGVISLPACEIIFGTSVLLCCIAAWLLRRRLLDTSGMSGQN